MAAPNTTPVSPSQFQPWASFFGGNVVAPQAVPSAFGAGALGQPPSNGQYTGGWAYPDAWANFYEGKQGFQAPQNQNSPAGALAVTNYANNINNPNDPNLLGWQQAYGNPNTILQRDQNWANSLGSAPTGTPSNELTGGWQNPEAWAAFYGGNQGFTAPKNAGSPASALEAAAQIAKTSSPQDNPALLGWVQDFGQPGSVLANTPNWAASLGAAPINAQGQGSNPQGGWTSPLAWAAYYGGFQGFQNPVDNTLQDARNWAGVTNVDDPSLLGWELDYGNPKTVVSTIEASPEYQAFLAAQQQFAQQQQAQQDFLGSHSTYAQWLTRTGNTYGQDSFNTFMARVQQGQQTRAQQQQSAQLANQIASLTAARDAAFAAGNLGAGDAYNAQLRTLQGLPLSVNPPPPTVVGGVPRTQVGGGGGFTLATGYGSQIQGATPYGSTLPASTSYGSNIAGSPGVTAAQVQQGAAVPGTSRYQTVPQLVPGTDITSFITRGADGSKIDIRSDGSIFVNGIQTVAPVKSHSAGLLYNTPGSGTNVPSFGTNNIQGSGAEAGAFGLSQLPRGSGAAVGGDPFNALYSFTNTTFAQAGTAGETTGEGTPAGGPIAPLYAYRGGEGGFWHPVGGSSDTAAAIMDQAFAEFMFNNFNPGDIGEALRGAQEGLVPGLAAPGDVSPTSYPDYYPNVDDLGRPIQIISPSPFQQPNTFGERFGDWNAPNVQVDDFGRPIPDTGLGFRPPQNDTNMSPIDTGPQMPAGPTPLEMGVLFGGIGAGAVLGGPIGASFGIVPFLTMLAEDFAKTQLPEIVVNPEINVELLPPTSGPTPERPGEQTPEESAPEQQAGQTQQGRNFFPNFQEAFSHFPELGLALPQQNQPPATPVVQGAPQHVPDNTAPTEVTFPHQNQVPLQSVPLPQPRPLGAPQAPTAPQPVSGYPPQPPGPLEPNQIAIPGTQVPGTVPGAGVPQAPVAPTTPAGEVPPDVFQEVADWWRSITRQEPQAPQPPPALKPPERKSVGQQTREQGRDASKIPDPNQPLGEWLNNQHTIQVPLIGPITKTGAELIQMGVTTGNLTQAEADKILQHAREEYAAQKAYVKQKKDADEAFAAAQKEYQRQKADYDKRKTALPPALRAPAPPGPAPQAPQPLPSTQQRPPAEVPGPTPGVRSINRNIIRDELQRNPGLLDRFARAVFHETSGDQRTLIEAEAIANRALARQNNPRHQGHSLEEALTAVAGHNYHDVRVFNSPVTQEQMQDFVTRILPQVLAGSNEGERELGFVPTGNASGEFGASRARQGVYRHYAWRGDEVFVQEHVDARYFTPPQAPEASEAPQGDLGTLYTRQGDYGFFDERGAHSTVGGQNIGTGVLGMNPSFAAKLRAAAERYEKETGARVTFGEATRDVATQQIYWHARGDRYDPRNPAAEPGYSRHQGGGAMDIQDDRFVAWLKNHPEQGINFPVPNDSNHAQETGVPWPRQYRNPQPLPEGTGTPGAPQRLTDEPNVTAVPDIGSLFLHTNWPKFEAEAPISTNIEGSQSYFPYGAQEFSVPPGFGPPPGPGEPIQALNFYDAPIPQVPEESEWTAPEAGSEQAEQDYLKSLYGPLNTLMKSNSEVADRIMGMAAQEIGEDNTAENYRAVAQMIANQILGWANRRSGGQPPGLDPARIGAFLNNEYGHWWGTAQTLAQARAKLNGMTANQRTTVKDAVMGALEGHFTTGMPTGNYSYSPGHFPQRPGVDVFVGDVVQQGLGGGRITNLVDVPGQTYPEALGSDQGNPAVTQWRTNRRNLMAGFRPGAFPPLPPGF